MSTWVPGSVKRNCFAVEHFGWAKGGAVRRFFSLFFLTMNSTGPGVPFVRPSSIRLGECSSPTQFFKAQTHGGLCQRHHQCREDLGCRSLSVARASERSGAREVLARSPREAWPVSRSILAGTYECCWEEAVQPESAINSGQMLTSPTT